MITKDLIQKIKDILNKISGKLPKIQQEIDKLKLEEMIRVECKKAGLTQLEEDELVATVWCESGMNPNAICNNKDKTSDYGLCQLNSYWYIEKMKLITKEECFDPIKSIRVMIDRWKKGRKNDWICYKGSGYYAYMPKSYDKKKEEI